MSRPELTPGQLDSSMESSTDEEEEEIAIILEDPSPINPLPTAPSKSVSALEAALSSDSSRVIQFRSCGGDNSAALAPSSFELLQEASRSGLGLRRREMASVESEETEDEMGSSAGIFGGRHPSGLELMRLIQEDEVTIEEEEEECKRQRNESKDTFHEDSSVETKKIEIHLPSVRDLAQEALSLQTGFQKHIDFLMARFFDPILKNKKFASRNLERSLQEIFNPLIIFKSFFAISCDVLKGFQSEIKSLSSPDVVDRLMAAFSIFTAKQLIQNYVLYAKNYDTFLAISELEKASKGSKEKGTQPADFAQPITHVLFISSLMELLMQQLSIDIPSDEFIMNNQQLISKEEQPGPLKVYFSLRFIALDPNFSQIASRITREKITSIQSKIRSTGLDFEIPKILDTSRRLLWSGKCLRASSALLSLKNKMKPYKCWLFTDILMWMDFRETKFKGILILSKDMSIKAPIDSTSLHLETISPLSSKTHQLQFIFDSSATRNILMFWILSAQQCLAISPELGPKSTVTLEQDRTFKHRLAEMFFLYRRDDEVVGKPYNLRHNAHVTENYEWTSSTGSVEDQFELLNQIGRGDFADVYRVFHKRLQLILSVKLLKIDDKKMQYNFRKELNILKECRHQSIINYYGIAGPDSQNRLWILMDWCRGGSVGDLIEQTGVLSESEIAYILQFVLKALLYLHSKLIVHRDIKSRNLLLTEHAEVKLTDFGVSTYIMEVQNSIEVPRDSKTFSNKYLARSPFWMAPGKSFTFSSFLTFLA